MSDNKNLGDILRNLPKNELAKLINELSEEEANQIYYDWQGIWCRDNQRYDPNWPETITIYLAGRGFGKTRLACEAIRQEEARGTKLFTICAPTAADIRDTIITGPSGILSCYPPDDKRRPTYYPSYSRLEWPSGAVARLISAENSERARGINTGFLYLDEVGSIDDIDIFHQLMFGLRAHPSKCIITTTPRANAIMIELSKRFGKDVRVITGSTYDNASNLTDSFITSVREAYEGTSLGESELHGKLILSSTDALWQQQTLMDNTIEEYEAPNYVSFSIGVDPAVSKGKHSDLTGIVVVALGEDDRMYVLGDFSGKYSPQQWSQKVVSLYDMYSLQGPTSIVVERNQGGI